MVVRHVPGLFAAVAAAAQVSSDRGLSDRGPSDPLGAWARDVAELRAPALLQEPDIRPRLRFTMEVGIAGGSFEHRTKDSTLDGHTRAGFAEVMLEGFGERGFGGGLRLEGLDTERDLFADLGVAQSEAKVGELFLYFGYAVRAEAVRCPIRFGLLLHQYEVDRSDVGVTIDYSTTGFRFEVEPDVAVFAREASRWSLYGNLSLGFGATVVESDPATVSADSSSLLFGLEAGTRVRVGAARFGLGYLLRTESIAASDVVAGVSFLGVDTEFSGLMLTGALVF